MELSRVPLAEKGGTAKLDTIEGRVTGARPGQQIVLFARSGSWYVQPFADRPLTLIQPDATWKSSTHLGTEYAALLVEPDYRPPPVTDFLPPTGNGVIAIAVADGELTFWQKRWFKLLAALAGVVALFGFYRFRLRQLTGQLSVRFEERLDERTRIAQDLHDTLLQGLISASMQLDVAVSNLPVDSPATASLGHVQQLMGQVIEEGQNTVRGLRSDAGLSLDLKEAFSRTGLDLALAGPIDFRVTEEGRRPLHPMIRDEVYRIGHEAITNAFRHARTRHIEVGIRYAGNQLRVIVRDDGRSDAEQVSLEGANLRGRAERIGARLKNRNRVGGGAEVELSVPGQIAYEKQYPRRASD